MLLKAIRDTGVEKKSTVMIGDTSYDMLMARSAGTLAIGVAWGYHSGDELLSSIKTLNNWPERVRLMQNNWIGFSKVTEIIFNIIGLEFYLNVFTTCPERIFGAIFIALSVEHTLSSKFIENIHFKRYIIIMKIFSIYNSDQEHRGR